jgi:hypothetical protein
VIGFAMAFADAPRCAIYVSGDTVWYEGVEEVARRFDVRVAFLFMGAARVIEVGPAHLTMTAAEAVDAARAFANATIGPLHFEGWKHFSEARDEIVRTFTAAGLAERLCWPPPRKKTRVGIPRARPPFTTSPKSPLSLVFAIPPERDRADRADACRDESDGRRLRCHLYRDAAGIRWNRGDDQQHESLPDVLHECLAT